MRIILSHVEPDDFGIAIRAAKWLIEQPDSQKDAILVYGEEQWVFYVRRNKASITVRRTGKSRG